MTDDKAKIEIGAKGRKIVQDIFDFALINARKRLLTIDKDEAEDNVEFDRAARTALALIRVAAEVDALSARKRKEEPANDKSGAVTDDDINRHEQELIRRLGKYIDGYTGGDAVGESARNGEGNSAGGRN